MTGSLLPPRVPGQIGATKSRVHDLERRLSRQQAEPLPYIAKFSLSGALYATTSGVDVHPRGGRLALVYADLGTVGSTTTELVILRNAVQIATLALPAGINHNEVVLSAEFSQRSDRLQIEIDTAGTGADSLTVTGEFTE